MHARTRTALLALGFDTNFIAKIDAKNHTVNALRSLSRSALLNDYSETEVDLIQNLIKRKPISDDVLERVLAAADEVCCFCADGNSARPYQIHHAEEYARTQDNSEDNLILVCPTHHQAVPKHLSPAQQKAVRKEWHAVVEIARAYRARGVGYPFGLFVAKDYGLEPRAEELIDGYRLSSATALAASRHGLAVDGLGHLRERSFLAIVGVSGDGKSTLAVGIAGHLWGEGYRVFAYQPPVIPRSIPVQDVLTFLRVADRRCVLLLDDANRHFSETDLTQIAAAAGRPVLVIATWTRDRLSDDPRAERHLPDWLLVNWERLRPAVHHFLLDHESAVVAAIRRRQHPREPDHVGMGAFDVSLAEHLRRYEIQAKTTSEFLFLVRGGTEVVRAEIDALADDSRADVPVLYAAIEQIAGFEQAVLPEQAVAASPVPEVGSRLPAPTPAWVRDVFETQRRRGRMQEARGAYTTVHRDWARRLIGTGLASARTRPELERLLAPNLNLRSPEPMRLMRLWTWLWYDESGGPYVRTWLARQTVEDWTALVGRAVAGGLADVGIVADRMHILFSYPTWETTVATAFSAYEDLLARAVATAGQRDWHSLKGLAFALGHACPDLAARVWEQWDPQAAATLVEGTQPDDYDTAGWVFSSIQKHSPGWVAEVGRRVRWENISARLSDVRPGDLEAVFECESLLLRLGIPVRRSMVRRYAEAMAEAMSRVTLSEFRIGFGWQLLWQEVFPDELRRVLNRLDPGRIAEELGRSRPRDWRALVDLASLMWPVGSPFFEEVIERVDAASLLEAVRSQAVGCEYELRCLLWVLARGREARCRELAERLYPEVALACGRSDVERPQLLRVLQHLHPELFQRLLTETDTNQAELQEPEFNLIPDDALEAIDRIRQEVAEAEGSGADYVISWQG